MINVTRKIEYALMVLKYIGDGTSQGPFTAREISGHFGTPFDTTSKVMQSMKSHSILAPAQGVKGGYTLNLALNELSYWKLATAIESKESIVLCESENRSCEYIEKCQIMRPIRKLNQMTLQFYKQIKIADLLEDLPSVESTTLAEGQV